MGSIIDVEFKIENILDSIADTKDKQVRKGLEGKLSKYYQQMNVLQFEVNVCKRQIKKLNANGDTIRKNAVTIKKLLKQIDKLEGQDRINARSRLKVELRKLLSRIDVFPAGIDGDDKAKRFIILLFDTGTDDIDLKLLYPKKGRQPIAKDYEHALELVKGRKNK